MFVTASKDHTAKVSIESILDGGGRVHHSTGDGSKAGTVLASHPCGPGWNASLAIIKICGLWVECVVHS